MITVNNLTIRYPRSKKTVLRDLSLEIQRGETVLLLGPSGCGKSTLAKLLAGLIPHNIFAHVEGGAQINNVDLLHSSPGEIAAQVGLLFQDPEAGFATLIIEDELAFGLENLQIPPDEMPERIQSALEQVGMAGFKQRRLETLSGGEAQRVALAALLAMAAHQTMGVPTLVLDEPTANLDPRATREFFETLENLKDQHTILLIEHRLDACFHLADRVILLHDDGSLMATGNPKTVYLQHLAEIEAAGIWVPESFLESGSSYSLARTSAKAAIAESTQSSISIQNLTFSYPHHPPVLKNLNLEIAAGDFLAIVGANGSGKSTLAKHLMGLLPSPREGQIQIFGKSLEKLSLAELTEQVGFVFQNPEHQLVTDTVQDELAYSMRARHWREDEIGDRVQVLLDRFELTPHASQNPFTLSQGQKRRLSVGTMLAVGQRILILDEPTFGQDRRTAFALMNFMAQLNRDGVTIVMVTHSMRFVRAYARQVAVLSGGEIAFFGTPEQLFSMPELLDNARLR